MTEMERVYQDYIRAGYKKKEKDGQVYYKAVWIEEIHMKNLHLNAIYLPYEMLKKVKVPIRIMNENDEIYELEGPAHIRFIDDIPEWYLKCGMFTTKETINGSYFRLDECSGDEDTSVNMLDDTGIQLADVTEGERGLFKS